MKKLPTYEECVKICNSYEESTFHENIYEIKGYKISLFNYRLASYLDFEDPIGDESLSARELRGLTFVFNKDGSLYKRYLLLSKFFNLNETEETLYRRINEKEIVSIQEKEDGSLLSFLELPNKEIIARSKMGFDNDISINSQKIFEENIFLNKFIKDCLKNNLVPIFEYVSPMNRIVLDYPETDLILTKVRNNVTGEYVDINNLDTSGINVAKHYDLVSLDELLEINKHDTEKEGYVVGYIDENELCFFKLKNQWYRDRHYYTTEFIHQDNIIVNHILDGNIDDILSVIDNDEIKDKVDDINTIVKKKVDEHMKESSKLLKELKEMSVKDFAIKHSKHKYFGIVMSVHNYGNDLYEIVIDYIKDRVKKLEETRNWLYN